MDRELIYFRRGTNGEPVELCVLKNGIYTVIPLSMREAVMLLAGLVELIANPLVDDLLRAEVQDSGGAPAEGGLDS